MCHPVKCTNYHLRNSAMSVFSVYVQYLYVHKRNGRGGVKIVKYDIPIIDTSVPKEKSHGGGRLVQPAADFEVLYVFSDYGLDTRIQIA